MTLPRHGGQFGLGLLIVLSGCGGGDSGTPPPSLTLTVSPASIVAGDTALLSWTSANASACAASGDWSGAQSTSGTQALSPPGPGTYTYALKCSSTTSAGTTESVMLTVAPAPLLITPDALVSGVQGAAYSQTLQATGGVSPFTWGVSSGALPHDLVLSDTTTSTVTISGTPDTAASGVSFTVTVTDAAQNAASKPYTLSILLQPGSLVVSSASLNFGSQLVGNTNGAMTETLTNTAGSDMTLTGIAIDAGGSGATEFKQAATTCGATLTAGASCTVDVTFTPAQRGPRSATLSISDNTADSPQVVSLSGQGLTSGPNATLSVVALPFGTQLVGTTSPALSLTLSNYGTDALNVGSIATSSSFAETDNCIPSLASGATCTIGVTFAPVAAGDVTGTLSIADDATGNPQVLPLTGTGSTKTPLLTGKCVEACNVQVPSPQCPAGQPSESPSPGTFFPCGPIGSTGLPVDRARKCATGGGTRTGHGFCGTH
jgi:trimeric autotransporter adhesin